MINGLLRPLRTVCASAAVLIISIAPARAQTTSLYLESQSFDFVGRGVTQTIAAADATFAVSSTGDTIFASVIKPDGTTWNVDLFAPVGGTIAPGSYLNATRFPTAARPALDVHGNGRGCDLLTGRFLVRELQVDGGGAVVRFAADVEQHCQDDSAGLFGAIRYNSTVSSLEPFDGAYPDYRITVVPAAGGVVSGSGLSCGATQTACTRTFTFSTTLTLTATPAAGYRFSEWAGACVTTPGFSSVSIHVNAPKQCEAIFVSSSEPPLTTALYVESQAGDPVGAGETATLTPFDRTFSFSASTGRVTATLTTESFSHAWFLTFEVPGDDELVPGTYLDAVRFTGGTRPGLSISSSHGSCNTSTGRFVIRELVQGPFGRVLRFAADFEQHCSDGTPALFGALRYNSTISSLAPFAGAYPDYRLTVEQPAHGTVTGDGISCTASGGTCVRTLASPASLTLTATPDPGYAFAGWSGSCFGGAAVAVNVNQPKRCAAFFESLTSASAHSSLFVDSRTGDPVGQGVQWFYVPDNSRWAGNGDGRSVRIEVVGTTRWSLDFTADEGRLLTPGTYLGAVRSSFSEPRAGLSVSGVSSCGAVAGRFVVHEVDFGPNSTLLRFAADFEQHCDNRDAGLYGAVRFNSTIPSAAPFNGSYPDYRLTITRPEHGTVAGPGIACSATQAACITTVPAPADVTLTATPDPGFVFVGWNGACTGLSTAVVRVNQPVQCEALFASPVSPRTVLYMRSDAGDGVGLGQEWMYSANAGWEVRPIESGTRRGVEVRIAGTSSWTLDFYGGVNATMAPGTFIGVPRYLSFATSGPAMSVSRGGFCSIVLGRFVVHEIVYANDGSIARFAADFEQHCNGSDAALVGAVRYNSTVSSFVPFGGAYPDYRLSVVRAAHGMVTGAGLACGTNQSACVRTSATPFDVELTAAPDPGFIFVGWRGICRGGSRTTVRVNQPLACEAQFDSVTAPTARTVLTADSQPGDVMGLGRQWFVGPNDGVWNVTPLDSSRRRGVRISISDNPSWSLEFDAGSGNTLVPGAYERVVRSSFSNTTAGLTVSVGSGFCSQISGRFVVREIEFATDNKVVRFAADFEQHCQKADPAMFGAVRFNSTVPTFTAFDGGYPTYTMSIVPSANGVVTGGGFDCGPDRGACSQAFGAPTTITLTATPARGFALRGWSGDCSGLRTTSVRVNTVTQCTPIFMPIVVPHDLDRDGAGDLTVWRPTDGTWYWATSSSGFNDIAARAKQWGSPSLGDVPLLADIDGDAVEDLVVWRASTGTWFWLPSSAGYEYAAAGSKQWGNSGLGDVPMLGDMDGDGRADLVVWRPTDGTFYWLTSSSGYSYSFARGVPWGNRNLGDKPMLGDFDGDGLQDLAVWRASTGTWFWLSSTTGYNYAAAQGVQWGSNAQADVVFTGDLDGDSRSELIVWRPGSGTWFWLTSTSGYSYAQQRHQAWGNASLGDVPGIGDFDGDRVIDLAVWRASTGTWYWLTSSSGFSPAAARAKAWGSLAAGDIPMVR